MSIPFTQYVRPNGRRRDEEIERPPEIEKLAEEFINHGGVFEAEVLMTGHVSLTAGMKIDGEWVDIAHKICNNGPDVPLKVDELVKAASEWMKASP